MYSAVLFLGSCSLFGFPDFDSRGALDNKNIEDELCIHFDSWKKSGISEDALRQGLTYIRMHVSDFENTSAFAIADYSLSSRKKRFFVFIWENGSIKKVHVSHGSGLQNKKKWGDINHDGMLDACDHKEDQTNMTRVGFFRASEYYLSATHDPKKWPDLKIEGEKKRINGLRLDGLSSTNNKARPRGVVMHEATYNKSAVMGRSFGCPAFRPGTGASVMPYFAKGGMYYSYVPQCERQQQKVYTEIPNWEKTCSGE
jgi:hypothetical protein